MLQIRSFAATAVVPESVKSVTAVMAIPVPNANPSEILTLAADAGGTMMVNTTPDPAVGTPAVL